MYQIFKKFMVFLALISVMSSSAWAFSPEVLFDDAVTSQAVMQDVHLINKSQITSVSDNQTNQTVPMPEQFFVIMLATFLRISRLLRPVKLLVHFLN